MSRRLWVLMCFAFVATPALADSAKSLVGRTVSNFTLKDFRGTSYSLSDFQKNKIVVIAFLGTECPVAKLYAPRLEELAKKNESRGVAMIGINSNRQDSITKIAAFVHTHKLTFPVLKDVGNRVADQIGARRTPEVFVLDDKGVIRYHGRVDDQYGVGYVRDKASRHELSEAIDRLLEGKPVELASTDAVGCFIGRIRTPNERTPITYSNQVARLFQKRCVECHRPGDIAPFSLSNYDEVAGWADTIAEVVRDGRMPPWHANPAYGNFAEDRRLSDSEKDILYRWAESGAPEGDRSELPPPKTFVTGWQLPKEPNIVIPMADKAYQVKANGEVRYQYFSADPGFKEDKWLKAAEVLPGNRAVVHHVLLFVQPPGVKWQDGRRGFLAAYVPGLRAKPLPEGMAKRIPAGSKLVFQVHYTPIGSVQEDLSKVGMVFADPKELTHMVATTSAVNSHFKIPPFADNYGIEANSPSYRQDVELLAMSPHMHLRGKSFRYEAVYPDGKKEILLDVPAYDFNWQTSYRLKERKLLPKGTYIHCTAHYDNSEENSANPDPEATVRWGDQTWNEMMIGYYDVAVKLDQKEFAKGIVPNLAADPTSEARELLLRFDKNGDGKISAAEIPARAKFIQLLVDKDHDGEVTLEELAESIRQRQQQQEQQ